VLKRAFETLVVVGIVISLDYAWRGRARRHEPPPRPVAAAASPSPPGLALHPVQPGIPAGFHAGEDKTMRAILAHFATGDFVTALKLADRAAQAAGISDSFHAWLTLQLPALLTSAGWERLKLGDCDEATTYLRRSEVLARLPATVKGLAVCYYKQKNLAGARDEFAYYLQHQPDDLQMQLLSTDVLESDGRFDEAVHRLEQLTAASDQAKAAADIDPKALAQRLASMRGRARESKQQLVETSRDFRLAYRPEDQGDLVGFVLKTLEDALDEYVGQYDFRPPPAPLEVALYPAEDFKSIVVGGPDWAEGLYDGRLRIPIKESTASEPGYGSLPVVLRHELVHALLAQLSDSRQIPPWFDEGLAQRLSCTGQPCATFRFPPQPGGFLARQDFETPYLSLSAVSAGRAYRQSLYLILALEHRAGDDALRQIISHVTTSSDLSSDGLLAPLHMNFQELRQTSVKSWMKREIP